MNNVKDIFKKNANTSIMVGLMKHNEKHMRKVFYCTEKPKRLVEQLFHLIISEIYGIS